MSNIKEHIVLKVKELSIGYKTKKVETVVASNLNFDLQQGQLIGLVGANGIGKSTLLRTLTKVQNPLNGNITINGKEIQKLSTIDLAKQLSLVLTEPLVAKNLSVYELVALGRQPYTNWIGNLSPKDQSIINVALEQTNILDLKDKKCYELSDGQLQKVMIARALAQDTDLIILDEPTTHLDMYHKAYVLKLLKQLTKTTNKTILFSSHEIDLAIQLCDTMIVMSKDNVQCNTPKQLISNGTFEKLFPQDLITFNDKTGSFRVSK
ncbi:ABC transporter ATP-binding protein [Winogradskyella immobilis]|uniref:ABC transporter ATP-binding protein n=1 Tax=Winogradskyella immobilis TaxID=2816852 RepID=A0ABS8EK46_9FLAO|nr:ABC transporter ATP-binding protein [Winogradskyella immobilis]MCC1483580.1 ABC transporter ATP-binding protein [Winogradskyella immobilis]MCG0015674.1 ABC transporter ATP-binding protein [Winogradskyella immobilis]